MAKYTQNLIADGSVLLCAINRRRDSNDFRATLLATGTFGSGSIALGLSVDGGSTIAPINDESGAVAITAATTLDIGPLGNGSALNDVLELWATLSGSTDADIDLTVFTNQ